MEAILRSSNIWRRDLPGFWERRARVHWSSQEGEGEAGGGLGGGRPRCLRERVGAGVGKGVRLDEGKAEGSVEGAVRCLS
jgi:hypothetical protein